ncbi:MAG: insulinase family protein [Spirochaetales bacterium]|nr:MAG: insulinase family protein [Spirochaetales bacterium]
MKKTIKIALICILAAAAAVSVFARGSKEDYPTSKARFGTDLNDYVPVDKTITKGVLSNGLTYYIRENRQPENRLILRLVVNAGSILEDSDQQGLAHFVEHMAFNGTEHFAKHELIDYLESIGMQFGPEINAYTSFDETVYKLTVPTEDPVMVEKAFLMLADWARGLSFEPSEIDKERGVIIEEWRLGRGAQGRMQDKYIPVLFQGSQYAVRLPIGKKEILESFTHKRLTDFYSDWYRPELMALISVGDTPTPEIKMLIDKYFSGLRGGGPGEKRRTMYPVPDHKETLFSLVTDPEATNTVVEVLFKRDVEEQLKVRDYRNMILNRLFDSMLNQRFYEMTQAPDPPFLFGVSNNVPFVRTKSVHDLACLVPDGGVERGLDALISEARRVRQFGFTAGELERAKKEMLKGFENAFKEQDKTDSNSLADEYIRNFLTNEVIPGIVYEYDLYRNYSPGITLNEVNRLAEDLMAAENRVISITGPEKAEVPLPGRTALEAVLVKAETRALEAYTDELVGDSLVSETPGAGKVVREKTWPASGITEWTLSNGAVVVMKPSDFKNDEILFSAISPGGTSLVPDKDFLSAQMTSGIIQASGAGGFSQVQLAKILAGKSAYVTPFMGEVQEGYSGSCTPAELETMLQLLYLFSTAPRKDQAAYESLKQRLTELIRNRELRPETLFYDTIQNLTTQGHFRSRPLTMDILKEMDLDAAFRIYTEHFQDASDFVYLFAGNFDPALIRPLVETWIGGLPAAGVKQTWKDPGILPPPGIVEKKVVKGIESKSSIALVFSGDLPWSRETLINLRALETILDIKLRETIREDASGTYGVRVQAGMARAPREDYSLFITFSCDPFRVDELTGLVFEDLKWALAGGYGDVYMTKAKEQIRRSYEKSIKTNGYWLANMEDAWFYRDDPEALLKVPALVDGITEETVRKAAALTVNLGRYVKVVLYPEQ